MNAGWANIYKRGPTPSLVCQGVVTLYREQFGMFGRLAVPATIGKGQAWHDSRFMLPCPALPGPALPCPQGCPAWCNILTFWMGSSVAVI